MSFKLVSILGILTAVACLGAATTVYPGGFDWNRDFISTLLRGPAGPARILADAAVLLFCVSVALVFWRLARATELGRSAKTIRIAGIGSMVYAGLTITPMHDVMVSISLAFLLVAVLSLLSALYVTNELLLFASGCLCLVILVASAAMYYTGLFVSVLPWAQRISFSLLAIWLVSLDFRFPRTQR
jgi:hypothetical protein